MTRLIDAHIHFWEPTLRHHAWLQEVPQLARPMLPGDVAFGATVPDGLVFVEADCKSEESFSEVEWVRDLAAAGAPIVGIVAHAPLERGTDVRSALVRLVAEPLVIGVRRLLQSETDAFIRERRLFEATRLLPAYGLTCDLCVTAGQLSAVTELVRACPETSFVLDHVGKPEVADRRLDPWREELTALARAPNVVCKLSGLTTLAPTGWRPEEVLPYLRHALGVFGPERCLFASDWPVSLLNTTYEGWLQAVQVALEDLTPAERAGVMGENACRTYGLRSGHAGR